MSFTIIEGDVVVRDSSGNPIGVILDGVTYRFAVDAKVTDSVLPTGAATEATLSTLATEATASTLATEATVSTLATESTASSIDTKLTDGSQQTQIVDGANVLDVDAAGRAAVQDNPSFDVLLSTRASEATVATLGTEATLSTLATEATLSTVNTTQTDGTQQTQIVDGVNVLDVDASGRAAIQDPPNLDVAASTLATEITLQAFLDAFEDRIKAVTSGGRRATSIEYPELIDVLEKIDSKLEALLYQMQEITNEVIDFDVNEARKS